MSLEHKLQAAAEPWLSEEVLPSDRAAALEALVKRRRRRTWGRWVATAATVAAVAYGVIIWPLVVSVASGTPVIGPFIARMATYDEGAHWAEEKGYVVPVERSSEDKGYTFRVESILADSARTVIYYVIDGPELEKLRGFPHARVTYNKLHPPGGSAGRGELVDGRLVGSIDLAPLTTPTALVEVHVGQIGELQGDWSVSFMASRMELDKLARVIPVDHQFKGEGYDLTLTRVLLAPTQTIIEMHGTVADGIEVRPEAVLTVGGVPVKQHGATYTRGAPKVEHRISFDRTDPETTGDLVFELTGVRRWHQGGPAIDLKEGARAEHGDFWMQYLGTDVGTETTVVSVLVPWADASWLKHLVFRDWTVVDAHGKRYGFDSTGATALGDGTARYEVIFKERIPSPVRLEVGGYAERVSGDFTVRIPLK